MPITENTTARASNTSASASNLTATLAGSVAATAGQLLIAAAGIGVPIANVTKPAGYTDLFAPIQISSGQALYAMYKVATGGETAVTWSQSAGANNMNLALLLFDGATASPTDKTATNPSDFAQHTSWATGTTAATTQADELALGFAVLNGAATAPSVNVGTLIINVGSNELLIAKNPLVATGAQAFTFSWTGSNFVVAGIATLKAAPVAPVPVMGMI